MEPIIRRYYRARRAAGRSRAAQIVDAAALRLVFAGGSYLWFRAQVPNEVAVYVLTAATTALFCIAAGLWNRLRFDAFVQREQERLREEAALEALLMAPREQFRSMVQDLAWAIPEAKDAHVAVLQQAAPLSPDDLLRAHEAARKRGARRLFLCSAGPVPEETRALALRLPIPAELYDRRRLARALMESGVLVIDDGQVEERIRSLDHAMKSRRKALQAEPFRRTRAWLIVAAALAVLSFFGGYALYYRLLAGLALSFAGVSIWMTRTEAPAEEAEA